MNRKLISLCFCALTGCLADVETETSRGFLDGPVLDGQDKARVARAFDDVIAEGERTIASLEREIASLEAQNRAKADEINSLVQQIEARRVELQRQHDNNLILCMFFPDPSICLLAVVIDNDGRMRDYNARLTAARTEQSRVQADQARYQQRRDALRQKLVPLRASRQRLMDAIEADDAPPVPGAIASSPEAAAAWVQAELTASVADAFDAEIAVLVEIRNAAAELSASLDLALTTVRGLATEVDGLVQDARDHFMDLLEGILSDDPDVAARRFLDDTLAARTKAMLASLDWPVRELVQHLIDHRADDESDPEALQAELLEAIANGAPVPEERSFENVTPLDVVDMAETVSSIVVPASVTATEVEVTVSITHTYRSDLRVWVEHDGFEGVLHARTGGGADDLDVTKAFTLPAGSAAGTWRLHVADEVREDDGRLESWTLTLRE